MHYKRGSVVRKFDNVVHECFFLVINLPCSVLRDADLAVFKMQALLIHSKHLHALQHMRASFAAHHVYFYELVPLKVEDR